MGLNEAQLDRFFKAYDTAKLVMRDLGIFPTKNNPTQGARDIGTESVARRAIHR